MNDQLDAVAKEDAADEAEADENTVIVMPESEAQANVKDVVLEASSSDDEADETAVASVLENAPSEGVETMAEEEVVDEGEAETTVLASSLEDASDVGTETVVEEVVVDEGEAEIMAVDSSLEGAPTVDIEVVVEEEIVDDGKGDDIAMAGSPGDEPEVGEGVAEQADRPSTDALSQADAEEDDSSTRVRLLSVGQQITGTVKRITDFGAFVDIGVGRDGLIHISELSVRRVGKVTDVLAEGQEITAWIKKLDRDRNRISLTLIDPGTKTIRDLVKGEIVEGTVTRILPYGAFVDIGIGRDALLHVREMGEGYVAKPEDIVQVGEKIETRIIELSRRRGRVDLSLKGLRPEPEPEPEPIGVEVDIEEEEDTPLDPYEELEVLSPMELAFKKAMEAEDVELTEQDRKQQKRNRRSKTRSIQDDIVSRTLTTDRK